MANSLMLIDCVYFVFFLTHYPSPANNFMTLGCWVDKRVIAISINERLPLFTYDSRGNPQVNNQTYTRKRKHKIKISGNFKQIMKV